MVRATGRVTVAIVLMSAAITLAGCAGGPATSSARNSAKTSASPLRIVRAPKSLMAVTEPQANGIMWGLAGKKSLGLFEFDSATGHLSGSVSVNKTAHSVAESSANVIGLALGTNRSGALQLLDGSTGKPTRTISLPAPARDIVVGSDGTTFYVLTSWATTASVTIVDSRSGKIRGTVPVPSDTVSVVPNIQQTSLYVLEKNGLVNEIAISGGKIASRFQVGREQARSLALSPDGSTLYVLKGTQKVSNVAVVNMSTQSVHRVLPAPSHCVELLVSPNGSQLYEVVGAPKYGNIQVFAV
jgi:hypothetical protein